MMKLPKRHAAPLPPRDPLEGGPACTNRPLPVSHDQVRSGRVYYSAKLQDHESHKAAFATSEVTSLALES
jgi:hypothetical protein